MTAWLLTWLWQGVALAMALSIVLHMLPRVNAATRYLLWWSALVALIVLGWQTSPQLASTHAAIGGGVPGDSTAALQVRPLPSWALSSIGLVWVSVALFRLVRILPSLHALYRLKDVCRPFPRSVEEQLPLWLESRGRRVRLALCDGLPGAALLGLHEPCIALPSSLVSELNAGDLDQIILHEYGHAQRRDDWMRLVQTLFEAALWIHPASFLIGRELNLEREVACDDWVIARTRSPRSYAACLSRVAEQRRARVAPAFTQALFGGRRDLVRRVDRLLDSRRNAARKPSLWTAAMGAFAIGGIALELGAFPLLSDVVVRGATPETGYAVNQPLAVTSMDSERQASTEPATRANRAGSTARLNDVVASSGAPLTQAATIAKSSVPERVDPVGDGSSENMAAPVEETSVLRPARVFEGVYQPVPTELSAAAPAPVVTPWQAAGDAGVDIGTAARNAGVGLADTFTKTGNAIARSFR